jgi:hypothetical protein
MTRKLCVSAVLLCMTSLLFAGPKGTVPRSSPSRYPAHGEQDGVAIGAKLLASDEARKIFSSDVNRCCVVVEVAVYPRKDKASDVSVDDFDLQIKNTETATKPSSPKVIAASLQKKARDQRDVMVSPSVGVGRSVGTYDPVYGPVGGGGVYTAAVVGVGVSGRGKHPGSTDQDRVAMETELSEKGLPEGTAATPVAGYLYFSFPRGKQAVYQLQYVLNGQKILLTLN